MRPGVGPPGLGGGVVVQEGGASAGAGARGPVDEGAQQVSRHFLDAHGQQAGSGAWESGRKLGRRRVVRVQELHENCA